MHPAPRCAHWHTIVDSPQSDLPPLPALSRTLSPSNGSLSKWFSEEVHPHDAQLKAYLRASFPTVRDVEDVVQDSYLRVWRARAAQPIHSAKAFLFAVAHRLALDLPRRERRSLIAECGDLAGLDVSDDKPAGSEIIANEFRSPAHASGAFFPQFLA